MTEPTTLHTVSVEEVSALLQTIQQAWNMRNVDALCNLYWERAVIIYPPKVFHGIEGVSALYRMLCNDPEQMGFMHLRATEVAVGFTEQDDAIAKITVESRILDFRLRWVDIRKAELCVVRLPAGIRIIEETEFPGRVRIV